MIDKSKFKEIDDDKIKEASGGRTDINLEETEETLNRIKNAIGPRYDSGVSGPDEFDCSGFQDVYVPGKNIV